MTTVTLIFCFVKIIEVWFNELSLVACIFFLIIILSSMIHHRAKLKIINIVADLILPSIY